jgi:cytoskeleton protein RodZ
MAALGEEFRSAREARGLTLSDVAEQIHIRSVYLNAIETDDWASIGAAVYVRGFIRTYARFLALDGEAAVQAFNAALPPERPAPAAVAQDRESSGPSLWAILGIVVALVLVAFAGYEWWSYSQAGSGPPVAAAPPGASAAAAPADRSTGAPASPAAAVPDGSPSPAATPAPNLRHALAIRLTQRSWLRVTVDGKTEIEGIFPPGTERTFTGNSADLRVGNAGGVEVAVDGGPPATLGNPGDVVEQHYKL